MVDEKDRRDDHEKMSEAPKAGHGEGEGWRIGSDEQTVQSGDRE
jgi:hypothetical protein